MITTGYKHLGCNNHEQVSVFWNGENSLLFHPSFQMTAMHTFKDDSVFNATTPPTLSSPNFAKTEWIYEATSGYLEEKKDADLKSVKYDYSVGGRLLTRTWARGLRTRYYYDSVGQLSNTHYFATVGDDNGNSDPSLNTGNDSNTKDLSYEYDRLGRLKTVRRDGAIHAEYDYDPGDLGLSTEELYADMNGVGQTLRTKLITRTRDLKLRPSTVAVRDPLDSAYGSDDHAYAYTYDGAGRLETVRHDATLSSGSSPTGGKVLTYSYLNQAGGLIETIDGPGYTVTNDWMPYRSVLNDKENRGKQTGTPVLSKYDYSVNKIGQRETVTQTGYAFSASGTTSASLSLTWGYNSRGELVSEDHSDNTRDNAYQFDGIGNREKSKHDSITLPTAPDPSVDYVSNSVNEYATVPGGFATAHDDDGNLTSGPVPGDQQNHNIDGSNAEVPLNATSLVWDGENRLVSVVVGSVTVDYEYDFLGRQIYRDASNAAAYWTIYDGWNEIGVYFGTQTPTCTFTWGKDLSGSLQGAGGVGGLLVTKHAGTDVYPLYDGNGNVTQYIDGSGVFAARWEYDSFGRTTKVYNGNLFATWAMLHRFSTKVMDYTTGLHYYGHRWYNSYTGRWPSRDPIGELGGANLYGMVLNDSVNRIDVLGLCEEGEVIYHIIDINDVEISIHHFNGIGQSTELLEWEIDDFDSVWDIDADDFDISEDAENETIPGADLKKALKGKKLPGLMDALGGLMRIHFGVLTQGFEIRMNYDIHYKRAVCKEKWLSCDTYWDWEWLPEEIWNIETVVGKSTAKNMHIATNDSHAMKQLLEKLESSLDGARDAVIRDVNEAIEIDDN